MFYSLTKHIKKNSKKLQKTPKNFKKFPKNYIFGLKSGFEQNVLDVTDNYLQNLTNDK